MKKTLISLAALALFVSGCSSPKPVDIGHIQNDRVGDAVAGLVALDQDLSVSTNPSVDVESDGAYQWFVKSVNPSGSIFKGDDVSLNLESSFDRAVVQCKAGDVEDKGATLIIDMKGKDAGSGLYEFADVECLLGQLEVPAAVKQSMVSTRALDGRQTGQWNGINAEWSYHPDNGLDIILTIDA